jgi:TolA-binding protein
MHSDFKDSGSFKIAKKRRNAVTEVIRFLCQQEFKALDCPLIGATPDQIYQTALDHMLNGDIKAAVRHLNNHGKNKMALMVSQSVNSV